MQATGSRNVILFLLLTAAVLCAAMLQPLTDGSQAQEAYAEGLLFGQETTPEPVKTPDAAAPAVFHVEVIRPSATPDTPPKRILIYHSHTWEAYTQDADTPYKETEKWRTQDNSANVVAVGTALSACLEALGCDVTHDITAFEPPDLANAYVRSLAMLEARQASGESYDLYIDLHRDAYDDPNAIQRTVTIGGQESARFMVLIGKGTGLTGAGYDVRPDWEANYAIAERITASLNEQADRLGRSICLRTGRFNQHIAPCSVLIECGSNHNTLQEVLTGVPYLAQAIADALSAQ